MTPAIRTIMAFDFGLRQIGVAVGNTLLRTTQSLPIIKARDGVPNWQAVEQVLQEWQPELLLVGDPLNMDGSDSELCERARKFARRLHGRFGLPFEMADERLTSFEAKHSSKELGHRGDFKRRPIDSLAAELVLQGWFSTRQETARD